MAPDAAGGVGSAGGKVTKLLESLISLPTGVTSPILFILLFEQAFID